MSSPPISPPTSLHTAPPPLTPPPIPPPPAPEAQSPTSSSTVEDEPYTNLTRLLTLRHPLALPYTSHISTLLTELSSEPISPARTACLSLVLAVKALQVTGSSKFGPRDLQPRVEGNDVDGYSVGLTIIRPEGKNVDVVRGKPGHGNMARAFFDEIGKVSVEELFGANEDGRGEDGQEDSQGP